MPSTTQKKKKASRTAGAQGARASSARDGAKKGGPKPVPFRREAGAAFCLFFAVFSVLALLGVQALFIDFFGVALKGLIGYGFWICAPALLLGAYILAFHRGRPVALRLWCALLLPPVMGCIFHLFLADALTYTIGWGMFSTLWSSGNALQSGGAVSGAIAVFFVKVFSKIGAAIVFILAAAFMALAAFNRTVFDIADAVRNRPRPEYELPPETSASARAQERGRPTGAGPARPVTDLPLSSAAPSEGAGHVLLSGLKKERFFNRKSEVKPPDEVLAGQASAPPAPQPAPAAAPAEPEPAAPAAPPDAPAEPVVAPAAPLPEIVREPAVQKLKREEVERAAAEVAKDIEKRLEAEPPAYQYPPVSLLFEADTSAGGDVLGETRLNQERLADTVRSFGIEARVADVTRGPAVTRYEVELEQGVRLNRLTNLADDIALALGVVGVRIAPIPDKISMVGIEVPNKLVAPVQIHEVIDSKAFCDNASKVSFAVGKDIGGNCIVGNIAKLPHLLIAGTTGSGKSVCTNSLIVSLLYKATPEEVRLIMVDPKMVELGIYNGIPHLLIPVVTDPKKASGALQWAVTEMMKRYRAFSEVGVRDLASFNAHAAKTEGLEKMPQVVIVIDELADLMLVAAKEVEESICRVAQMGRAAGMHLIIATQRPSADVITGLMKANIPSRIAFAVASALESRIILDTQGAEKLVGRGDMLWFPLGAGKPLRVQGCLISDEEVAAVVEFVKTRGQADYDEQIIYEIERHAQEKEKGGKAGTAAAVDGDGGGDYDEMLSAAIEVVVETGMASVSMLQRRLKLGYSRAARLVDQMEEKGVVGPFEGSKPRQVLITKAQWQEMRYRQDLPLSAAERLSGEEEPEFEEEPAFREDREED